MPRVQSEFGALGHQWTAERRGVDMLAQEVMRLPLGHSGGIVSVAGERKFLGFSEASRSLHRLP
jgi:hypothetical protein